MICASYGGLFRLRNGSTEPQLSSP